MSNPSRVPRSAQKRRLRARQALEERAPRAAALLERHPLLARLAERHVIVAQALYVHETEGGNPARALAQQLYHDAANRTNHLLGQALHSAFRVLEVQRQGLSEEAPQRRLANTLVDVERALANARRREKTAAWIKAHPAEWEQRVARLLAEKQARKALEHELAAAEEGGR